MTTKSNNLSAKFIDAIIALANTDEGAIRLLASNPISESSLTPADQHNQEDTLRGAVASTRVAQLRKVIRRFDWTSGSVYSMYDDLDASMADRRFIVLVDGVTVYKCLFSPGTTSTAKPSGTTVGQPFTMSDGYTWVKLFTVSEVDMDLFGSSRYIPLPETNSATSSTSGAVNVVKVENGGIGYKSISGKIVRATTHTSTDWKYFLQPDMSSSTLGEEITALASLASMTGHTISLNGGEAIAKVFSVDGQTVKLASYGNGTTDTFAVLSDGEIGDFTITPRVIIESNSHDGDDAEVYAVVDSAGVITSIVSKNGGSGYRNANAVITSAPNTSGSIGSLRAIVSPLAGHASDFSAETYCRNLAIYADLSNAAFTDYFAANGTYTRLALVTGAFTETTADEAIHAWKVTLNTTPTVAIGDVVEIGSDSENVGKIVAINGNDVWVVGNHGTIAPGALIGSHTTVSAVAPALSTSSMKVLMSDDVGNIAGSERDRLKLTINV